MHLYNVFYYSHSKMYSYTYSYRLGLGTWNSRLGCLPSGYEALDLVPVLQKRTNKLKKLYLLSAS